jgi:hypothetical protein
VRSDTHAPAWQDRPPRSAANGYINHDGLNGLNGVVGLAEMPGRVDVPAVVLRVVRVGALCLQMSACDRHRGDGTYERILQMCWSSSRRLARHLSLGVSFGFGSGGICVTYLRRRPCWTADSSSLRTRIGCSWVVEVAGSRLVGAVPVVLQESLGSILQPG